MAKAINAPKMGNTVESIILGDIKVKVGDSIKVGDVIFEYETDKSTTEFKSEDAGEVLKIIYESGDEVEVLKPIIIIGKKGEDISEWDKKEEKKINKSNESSNISANNFSNNTQNFSNNSNERSSLSPRARETAKYLGVNEESIKTFSGVAGRIMERDVLKRYYDESNELDESDFTKVKYSAVRKAIAKSMEFSVQHGAQLTLLAPFDASALLEVRNVIKTKVEKKENIQNSSINDLIVYVLARTLAKFPHINSIMGEDFYNAYHVAHISIAVDTPKGLFVPVVRNASVISLNEITLKAKELIIKARDGKLSPQDQNGGTFTISNLGLSGVMGFTPILNPPQASILGVGSPIKRLKMVNKEVIEYSEIVLSLTMDHRPFDGAQGADFLKALVKELETVSFEKFN